MRKRDRTGSWRSAKQSHSSPAAGRIYKNVVQSKIKQYSFDELYGNLVLKKEIQQDFEHNMRTTLNRLGMNLIHLPSFDYDESYWTEIVKGKGGVGKGGQLGDIKDSELQLRNRERARAAGEEVNKLKNEDEIKKFIHELAKEGIIRDYDKIEMQRILQENLHDLGMVRNQIREKLAHTHGIGMQKESLGFEVESASARDRLKDEILPLVILENLRR